MKEWWNRKKARTRKARKGKGRYTFSDLLVDVMFWIPELILLPLRISYWMLRGLGRLIGEIF
ncbi:hypothetical protein [Pseudalkalibacillus berkeleyi]|uniref:Uncharacterized protein n=1 Tax=Pseudalkalibacillus berkeleyi TaxID=1069813 RepID=A0ABS9H4U8_9BACL|nr:hypothetical protein [Pseudalkalibacillus berkeleyi]MCF6138990.1 hypothetical protein [Pseudalkalibacillus berkeleyi]